ncbi:MAG: winged helix-turn-helix domain-containing protein [Candidatus Jordarchaeales archaeon]
MPQSKKNETLRREKIKAKIRQIAEKQAEETERKILEAIKTQEQTFSQLLEKTKLSRGTLNKYLKRLQEKGKTFKLLNEKGEIVYSLTEYPSWMVFQYLATIYLHHSLRSEPIEVFNEKLGSLITYILSNYKYPHSLKLLTPILEQVEIYLTPTHFKGTEYEIHHEPPKIESKEWELWKDIDSRNYVIKIDMPYGLRGIIKKEVIDYPRFKEKWLKFSKFP